jgi:tetratricopeptide (TPR) repeat protein
MSARPPAHVIPELRETLLTQFTAHLMGEKDFGQVIQVLQSPWAKTGGLAASLHFTLGLALMELQRFDEAIQHFRHCLGKRHQPALAPINKAIRRAAPNHCLALCLAKLGQGEAAAQAFCAALADEPESRPVRLDYAKFLSDAGQPIEGMKLLHQLVSEQATDLFAWLLGGQIALSRPDFLEFACDWTGEAEKHFPDEPRVLAQRAEALVLTQQVQRALLLWRRCQGNDRAGAALVLCQLLSDEDLGPAKVVSPAEPAVSQEFLRWYRRLLDYGAAPIVQAVNSKLDRLRTALPTASQTLEKALAEAAREAAV